MKSPSRLGDGLYLWIAGFFGRGDYFILTPNETPNW